MGNGKKTLGKRKIEMKKIEKESSLRVSFSKRKGGLFKKASQLSVLCGAEVAILLQSPANKLYAFGDPSLMIAAGDDEKPVELERKMHMRVEKEAMDFWWEQSIEGLGLQELEEFLAGLECLRKNVNGKLELLEGFGAQKLVVESECLEGLESELLGGFGMELEGGFGSELEGGFGAELLREFAAELEGGFGSEQLIGGHQNSDYLGCQLINPC